MMSYSTVSVSEDKSPDDYIKRGKKEEDFRKKLNKLIYPSEADREKEKSEPFLFFINGVAGIGKRRLIDEIADDYDNQDDVIFIRQSFDKINTLRELLDLMKFVNNDVNSKLNSGKKHVKDKSKPHFDIPWKNDKVPEEFSEALKKYKDLITKLKTVPIDNESNAVTSEQQNDALMLPKVGAFLVKEVVSTINPLASTGIKLAQSLTEELAEPIGEELGKHAVELYHKLKDDLLNQHKCTKGKEKIQELLLSPLKVLTPKLISSLVYSSKIKPIILIFEKYDTARNTVRTIDNEGLILETWFYYLLQSLSEELINKENREKGQKSREQSQNEPQPKICLIISSREKLTTVDNWKKWEEDYEDRYDEYSIQYLNEKEIDEYLKKQLGKDYEELTPEEKKSYGKTTCGHPRYLEMICQQKKLGLSPDDSQINQKITDKFLSSLSSKQKKVIQLVSCCRCLDPELTENCIDSFKKVFPSDKNFPDPNFDWFEWLLQHDFVRLEQDKFNFENLPRNLFRRSLFQEDREQFYRGHQQLAEYFQKKAAKYLPDKPNFAKYCDSEWCEYIGKFLYHACFAETPEFEKHFLYHLFASCYLSQGEVLKHSFWAINKEFNLDEHPFLHDTTKKFLKTLKFVATYSWAAFELDSETNFGQYKPKIAATVLLCKSQWKKLDPGIGKVAVLEFILKNLPANYSNNEEERKQFEESLSVEIEETANYIYPDFSSKLLMQSALWQTANATNIIKWCDRAIKYKPNNANAWYKKGTVIKEQAIEMLPDNQAQETLVSKEKSKLAIDKLGEALSCYDQALKIQPYDHRFWLSRGDVLMKIGNNFLSINRQISELIDGNISDYQDKSGTILQKAAYHLRAYYSYEKAKKFKPLNDDIETLKKQSLTACCTELNNCWFLRKFNICLPDIFEQQTDDSDKSRDNDGSTFIQKIDQGDTIRLQEVLDTLPDSDKEEKLNKALDCYRQAIHIKPEYPLGWYSRGLALSELGNLKESEKMLREAIEDFTKSLEIKDDLAWAFYDRGIAHYRIAIIRQNKDQNKDYRVQEVQEKENNALEEYEKALNDFDQAIGIDAEYDNAWYYRGLVIAEINNYQEQAISGCQKQAIAAFDRAIQICQNKKQPQQDNKPTKEEIRNWYDRGKCYRNSKANNEEAIASYKKAISCGQKYLEKHKKALPPHLNSLLELGFILCDHDRKKYDKAIHKFKQITILDKNHVDGHYHLALALYEFCKHTPEKELVKYKQVIEKYNQAIEELSQITEITDQQNQEDTIASREKAKEKLLDKAKTHCEKAIELSKKEGDSLLSKIEKELED